MGIITDNKKSNLEKRKDILDYLARKIYPLKLSELKIGLDGQVYSSKDDTYAGRPFFNEFWNTRYLLPTELRIEFDTSNWTEMIKALYDTWSNLEDAGIHFAVFFAEGQRSPHIIIYDLLPENSLTELQRKKSRELFAKKVVPKRYWSIVDKKLFGNHKVQLEFALHWKYNSMFLLIYESIPYNKKTKIEQYYDEKGINYGVME